MFKKGDRCVYTPLKEVLGLKQKPMIVVVISYSAKTKYYHVREDKPNGARKKAVAERSLSAL
jgi:hypothetical protein